MNQDYMQQALSLASNANCQTSPNPKVGCVIIKDNKIAGEGWHNGPGTDHAEVMALKMAGPLSQGANVYVTLEPCCHTGNTPPCINALIQAKVKHVFIATLDPNPLVSGKGVAALNQAGIETTVNILQKQARELNQFYFHFMEESRPYVINKWAMSLDGYSITSQHDSKQISSKKSENIVHEMRNQVDAILIGSNTALSDNPRLTTRLEIENPHHPIRLVLDSKGKLPTTLKLFSKDLPGKTILITTDQSLPSWRSLFTNTEIWILEKENGHVSLNHLMKKLHEEKILSVFVEGGRTIHNAFFNKNLSDEVHAFIAPIIIGQLNKKKQLTNIEGDIHVHGYC